MFTRDDITNIELDAAGLVALADLKTIQNRTALTGTSSYSDLLFLAPGIHCHQSSEEVNGGEYPVTGQLTGGHYVFRVENQATVFWLQRIGETGKLVEVQVSRPTTSRPALRHSLHRSDILPTILYFMGISGTITIITLLGVIHDFWGVGVLLMLIVARVINVFVIKQRSQQGWKGDMNDDGVESDLLIILSQDRWVRMRGAESDVKAVTAGCWLRDMTALEGYATSFATVLVYASAALAGNASTVGSLMVACLLLISAGFLGVANSYTNNLHMFGRMVSVVGEAKAYPRRRLMVDELAAEVGDVEWAINMDLIPRPTADPSTTTGINFAPAPGLQTPSGDATLRNRPTRNSSEVLEKGSMEEEETETPKLGINYSTDTKMV